MEEAFEKAKKTKMVILDVDGVMTDGNIGIGDDGVRHGVLHQSKSQGTWDTILDKILNTV